MGEGSEHEKINMATKYITTYMLLQYFTDAKPVAEEKSENNQILITKENKGPQGSKEYSKSYYIITKYLETNIGTAKHLLQIFAMTNTMEIPNTESFKTNFLVIITNWRHQKTIAPSIT